MNSISPSNPNRNDFNLPRYESDEAFEVSQRHRFRVLSARENLEVAKRAFKQQQDKTRLAVQASDAAKIYLQQLEAGWGAPLAQVGPATLYEFWLQLPGYSGPVRGFSASSNQTGQIQHVSHVTSNTTSGAGCATLGCLAAGPVGAVAGATMGKKNDVRTHVQVIDNRRFEIQVVGPGVAWSYVGNYTIEDSVRSFRDLLLARSTNLDDPRVLAIGQKEVVAVRSRSTDLEYMKLNDADQLLKNATATFEAEWSNYESVRLPFSAELIARWKRSSLLIRTLSILFGPLFTLSWIFTIILAANEKSANSPNIVAIAVIAGILQLVLITVLVVYYRIEIRLLKTLPSESSTLQPIFQALDRILKQRQGR